MSKISDEIREWCELCGGIIDSVDKAELDALADRIDSEMVELPKDRDGVPIHVGDTVYLEDGRTAKVTRIGIGIYEDGIYALVSGYNFSVSPEYVSHTRPDSWERIANELEELSESNRINGSGEVFYRAGELAARIRRLAETEGE